MDLRPADAGDWPFLVEMARLASTLEGRPLPEADDPSVLALLPTAPGNAVIALTEGATAVGAAWWHVHEPPLVLTPQGTALPELVMAVSEPSRRQGIGTALVEVVAAHAAEHFDALALNVHLLNPAVHLYMRTGFEVAAHGRGRYGVAMVRSLR